MCMSSTQRFITSTGQIEPAMIAGAERGEVVVGEVGVALHGDEHRRDAVHRRAPLLGDRLQRDPGSKPGAGITMVAPWVVQPRLPITMPKQW